MDIQQLTPEQRMQLEQMQMEQMQGQMQPPQNEFVMGGFSDKIMGMENMTPKQDEYGSMSNHMPNQIMGAPGTEGQNVDQQMNVIVPQGGPPQNPFANEQYNNVNLPDAPIQFGGGMAEQLLNDNEVPKEFKKKYWYIFHKDNILTFLDENRKASKLLNIDINKIDILNAMPYYDYDFNMETEFGVMRNIFETKLDRALGFKGGGNKNERIILQSQFSENRNINETGEQSMAKEGFFKRLLGRR